VEIIKDRLAAFIGQMGIRGCIMMASALALVMALGITVLLASTSGAAVSDGEYTGLQVYGHNAASSFAWPTVDPTASAVQP
jgi:hypothetical protein